MAIHDAPAAIRARLDLRRRHERLLAEITGFAMAAGEGAPRVVCAWCAPKGRETVLHEGDPNVPVSHGICPDCLIEFEAGAKGGGALAHGPEIESEVSMDHTVGESR